MPFQVQPFPVVVTTDSQESRFRVERGRLKGVTLRNSSSLTVQNRIFGQIWITFDDNPANLDGILLAQGMLGSTLAISWTGDLKLLGAMSIRSVLWSDVAGNFQTIAYTEVP